MPTKQNRFRYAGMDKVSSSELGELFARSVAKAKDPCESRHGGNPESRAAFNAIRDRLTKRQDDVLRAIKAYPDGATSQDVADYLSTGLNSISGRCSELKAMGKIYKSGVRKTRSGNSAAVLKAV